MNQTLSEDDFNSVVSLMKLSDRQISMAKEVLVNGKSSAEVGRLNNVSREAPRKAAAKVFQCYLQKNVCPVDWVVITLRLPIALAEDLKKKEKELIEQYYFQRNLNNDKS